MFDPYLAILSSKKVELATTNPDFKYFASMGHEMNPALGCRAVRFLMRYPEILERQLRAILRASIYGEIHILIPMVYDISEIRFVRHMIEEVSQKLEKEGHKVKKGIPLGCMIEVPSSAIMCDVLAQEVDFLSIGTNDLIQYTYAVDRTNARVRERAKPLGTATLRLVAQICRAGVPVAVCGQLAGDEHAAPLLVGLGVRELSVAPARVPAIKRILSTKTLAEMQMQAQQALGEL